MVPNHVIVTPTFLFNWNIQAKEKIKTEWDRQRGRKRRVVISCE